MRPPSSALSLLAGVPKYMLFENKVKHETHQILQGRKTADEEEQVKSSSKVKPH